MLEIIATMFVTGLLFGSGACLISCGPVLFSYICATNKNIKESLSGYAVFSFWRVLMYVFVSGSIFWIGEAAFNNFFSQFGRYLYITAGFFLAILGVYFILGRRMELKPFNLIYKHIVKGDMKNMALLGAIYGLLPCGPFLGVLSYIGLVSRALHESLLYSFIFGLGTFCSLLVFIVAGGGALSGFLSRRPAFVNLIIRILCGIAALYLGAGLVRRAF